jgi:hypothetical protein
MDGWGQSLLGAVTAVARMAALGWGIRKHSGHAAQQAGQQDRACSTAGEAGADGAGHASSGGDARASACAGAGASGEYDADAFARLMEGGPHLLAPTGSDLAEHGALGSVLAGFHYDLNFITVRACCWVCVCVCVSVCVCVCVCVSVCVPCLHQRVVGRTWLL